MKNGGHLQKITRLPNTLISFILLLVSIHCGNPPSPRHSRKVFVEKEGKQYVLYRNGHPFVVKGASGYTHLEELRQMGGNTIRTWDTVNLAAILNAAQRNNLAVIVGLSVPASSSLGYFYKDTAKVNAQYRALQHTVEKYKNHPALLMWCLGNELEFKPGYAQRPFYNAFNNLVNMIHTVDPDHPVTTTMANFSIQQTIIIQWRVHHLDLISINIFGQLETLERKLQQYAWWWSGPFLVTEWGAYGPWEVKRTAWDAPIEGTSTKKAEQCRRLYARLPLNNTRCLGALIFYWGQKQETTPTWFSLFDEQGRRTEAVNVIEGLWTGRPATGNAPAVRYMLLNKKGAADNIMVNPGSLQSAELLMEGPPGDSLVFQWQVMQEDWFSELGKKPLLLLDTVITGNTGCLFRAPVKEGPYRVYVKVLDSHGQVATANTPFYVVK